MTEAHDENSINTDITFESGDENVSFPRNVVNCLTFSMCSIVRMLLEFQDDVISLTSTSNTDTTSRSRSGTPTNKVTNGNKRGKKGSKIPKVEHIKEYREKRTFKFQFK